MLRNKKHECKELWLYGLILLIAIVLYHCTYITRTFTMSEGWRRIYNAFLDQGKVPYRDFYYYLPPLNLLIDYILERLSFGMFFLYRVWRLAERCSIAVLLYCMFNSKRQITRLN